MWIFTDIEDGNLALHVKNKIDTIAIGSFDGIHLGHMQLINKLGKNGALLVIDKDNANLTPGLTRSKYSQCPCMYYRFLKVKNMSGEEFVKLLKKEFINLKKIVIGYDFIFGAKRSCVAEDLNNLFDGEVEIVEEFIHDGISVHSTYIRGLVQEGKLKKANSLLGREYSIIGDIVKGQGQGQEKIYPTINIKARDYLLPLEGVYLTRICIKNKVYDSITFLGTRVSTDDKFSIETYILGKKIRNIGESIEIFFVKYLRENKKFDLLIEFKN